MHYQGPHPGHAHVFSISDPGIYSYFEIGMVSIKVVDIKILFSVSFILIVGFILYLISDKSHAGINLIFLFFFESGFLF